MVSRVDSLPVLTGSLPMFFCFLSQRLSRLGPARLRDVSKKGGERTGVTVGSFLSSDSGYRGACGRGGRVRAEPSWPLLSAPFSSAARQPVSAPGTEDSAAPQTLRTLLPSSNFILTPLQAKSASSAHHPEPQHFQLKSP